MTELSRDLLQGASAIAEYMQISESRVYAGVRAGTIPAFRLGRGRSLWARASQIDAAQRVVKPAAPSRRGGPAKRESERGRITYAILDATLAQVNDIAPAKRTAFMGRLKNLIRLDFMGKPPSGKGRASYYTVEDVLQFALAVELIQSSVSPEMLVEIMPSIWEQVGEKACAIAREGKREPLFIGFTPEALRRLRSCAHPGVVVSTASNFIDLVRNVERRAILLDLASLVEASLDALANVSGIAIDELRAKA